MLNRSMTGSIRNADPQAPEVTTIKVRVHRSRDAHAQQCATGVMLGIGRPLDDHPTVTTHAYVIELLPSRRTFASGYIYGHTWLHSSSALGALGG
jgi:hypothetical protein